MTKDAPLRVIDWLTDWRVVRDEKGRGKDEEWSKVKAVVGEDGREWKCRSG